MLSELETGPHETARLAIRCRDIEMNLAVSPSNTISTSPAPPQSVGAVRQSVYSP